MAPGPLSPHLGCTVYYFGDPEQNRLLVECIGPLARSLAGRGLCRRLWFSRFDARAPHVFAVFTPAPGQVAALADPVSSAVAAYLDAAPSRASIAAEVLDERHRACRGKIQSAVDGHPGRPDNNSFVVHEHAAGAYPFALTRELPGAEALWQIVSALSLWAIDRLAEARGGAATAPAMRWLAALERALAAAGCPPRSYWRYHAATLTVDLDGRIASEQFDPDEALARLGDRNRRHLARLWRQDPHPDDPDPARLVELVGVGAGAQPEHGFQLLREVVHVLLLQLGVRVGVQIVAILYAWLRAAAPAGTAAPGGDAGGDGSAGSDG